MAITVLLVDDHCLVREAVRDVIARELDITVTGEAGDAAGALERAGSLMPDVVVLDADLPDLETLGVVGRLIDIGTKIVALSQNVDQRFVTELLQAGVAGYVTKSFASTAELILGIRAVAAGQSYLCSKASEALATAVCDSSRQLENLSRREREVLRLIAEGVRGPAIAGQLGIALGTVEVHRRNIMRKLGRRGVAKLTRYAVREGLVGP